MVRNFGGHSRRARIFHSPSRLTVLYRPIFCSLHFSCIPRSGELRTQKLKSHLVRTQSLNVLPLRPGVGQYIAMHATLTARDFFLANFYPSGPITRIFSKTSAHFFLRARNTCIISPVSAVFQTGHLGISLACGSNSSEKR